MFRGHTSLLLLGRILDMSETRFAIGKHKRTAKQEEARAQYSNKMLSRAFPDLRKMWVQPVGGRTSLANPNNLNCLSAKKQVWRCPSCGDTFEQSVAAFLDTYGQCTKCLQIPTKTALQKLTGSSKSYASSSTGVQTALGLPQAGTGSSGVPERKATMLNIYKVCPQLQKKNFDPMLALSWPEALLTNDFSNEKLFVSPKLDGVRCIIVANPAPSINKQRELFFLSRRGAILECCDHLIPQLLPLFRSDPSLVLDGEIFSPSIPFQLLNGIIRTRQGSKSSNTLLLQRTLEFHCFDIMYSSTFDHRTTGFGHRYKCLLSLIPQKRKLATLAQKEKQNAEEAVRALKSATRQQQRSALQQVFHVPCTPMKQSLADAVMLKMTEAGFEGIMIRRDGFPYGFGKRSNPLMKHKAFDTAEYIVLSVTEGIGRCKGQAGSLICKTAKGDLFRPTPKSDAPLRKAIWERRKEIVGKAVTVQYQGLSEQGVPRFPVAIALRGSSDGSDWF